MKISGKPAGVEHGRGRDGARGQPAGVAARRHRADEHVAVAGVDLHAHPVAQDRAAGDRARRVDGQHRHRPAAVARLGDQRRHERALARPGRPGHADQVRLAGQRVEHAQRRLPCAGAVLDLGQQPGQRAAVASAARRRLLPTRASASAVRVPSSSLAVTPRAAGRCRG